MNPVTNRLIRHLGILSAFFSIGFGWFLWMMLVDHIAQMKIGTINHLAGIDLNVGQWFLVLYLILAVIDFPLTIWAIWMFINSYRKGYCRGCGHKISPLATRCFYCGCDNQVVISNRRKGFDVIVMNKRRF